MHILLVEDNPTNQRVALKMLKSLDHTVELVENGLEAVEQATAGSFDAILMDIQMPVMDGLEATRQIHARMPTARPPIIAVTANAIVGDRETYLSAGMDDYLSKPLRRELLRVALESNVAKSVVKNLLDAGPPVDTGIDFAQLTAVIDADDPECVEILEDFALELPKLVESLENSFAEGDSQDAQALAHQMTGSLGIFGFVSLAKSMADLEAKGREGQLVISADWKQETLDRFSATLEEARKHLGLAGELRA